MASNRIKGITIEIGGDTTGLDQALKKVNSTIRDTKSELKEVNKALNLNPGNAELIAQKQRVLGEAISQTTQKLQMLKTAQEQASAQLANGSINQSQYDALTREIIKTETELKKLNTDAIQSGMSLREMGGLAGSVASGFANFGAQCTQLGQKLTAVSAAAGAVVAGFISMAVGAAEAADSIATAAKQTGLTTTEVQALQYASKQLDVPFETVSSAITKMKGSLTSSADAFASIGVKIKDQNGHLRDTNQIFFETVKALGKIENETERDTMAMQIFGKSANQLAGLIDDGGAAMRRLSEEAQNKGLIISEEDIEKANQFNDAIDAVKTQLKAAFAGAGTKVAESLLPIITDLASAASRLAEVIAKIPTPILQVIMVATAILAVAAPLLIIIGQMATGISTVITAVSSLGPAIGAVTSALTSSIGAISAFVAANAATLGIVALVAAAVIALGIAIYEVVTHWDQIKTATASATNSMKESIENSNLGKLLANQIDSMKEFATSGLDEIANAFSNSSGVLEGIWNAGLETIQQVTRTVIRNITGLTSSEMDALSSALSSIWNAISNNIAKTWDGISSTIVNKAKGFVNNVVSTIKELPEKIRQALSSMKQALVEKITQPFESIVEKAKTWGKDLIDNFISGLSGGSNSIKSATQSIAQIIDDNIGFSEPKEGPLSDFHKNAPDMIDLWVKGIKENMYKVTRATTSLASSMNPASVRSSESAKSSSIIGGNTSTMNIYVDHISELSDLIRIQNQAQQRSRMGARA